MSLIREAMPSDLGHIIELVRRATNEVHASMGFDPEVAAQTLSVALCRDNLLLLVAERHSRIVGFLYAGVNRSWFGQSTIASDFMVYTLPSVRGHAYGYMLHKQFVQWAKDNGASVITSSNVSDMPEARWLNVMRRLGYEYRGAIVQQGGC